MVAAKIGVSGLSGLVGKELARTRSLHIELVPSVPFSRISLDSVDAEIGRLAALGVQGFLHLAWPAATSRDGDYKTSQKNFEALEKTIAVRQACEKRGVRFFGTGTGIDRFADPKSNYSIAKHKARQIFLEDINSGQISWIRPHFVFNGKDWPKFIYSDAIQPIVINDDSPRDFIHIKDVALGIKKVLENKLMGEIDIGSGILRRPSDLCKALGLKFSTAGTHHVPRPNNTEARAANSLILCQTGWQAKYTEKIFGENQAGQSLDVS